MIFFRLKNGLCPIIPLLRNLRQKDYLEFKASQSIIARLFLNQKATKRANPVFCFNSNPLITAKNVNAMVQAGLSPYIIYLYPHNNPMVNLIPLSHR